MIRFSNNFKSSRRYCGYGSAGSALKAAPIALQLNAARPELVEGFDRAERFFRL